MDEKSYCKGNVAILVTRWPTHTLVYFNILIAILIKISGYTPIIILDDFTSYSFKDNLLFKIETYIFLKILKDIKTVYLSNLTGIELNDLDMDEIRVLSRINTYYKEKTTVPTDKSKDTYNDILNNLVLASPKIKSLFACEEFELLIIPGGVFGHTGLYIHFGNKYNVRVSSYDSGPNIFIIGTDNVAGYLKDIPNVLCDIQDLNDFKNEIKIAKDEFEKRQKGKDTWQYQPVPYNAEASGEEFDVVIPLNVEIDTASLIKTSNFENMYFWLKETVEFLLKNTTARIAIKDHPSIYNRTDFLRNYIITYLVYNPRVRYYSINDKINTYELLNKSRIVLPYTSTVGIEAAIMDKCVILESGVYYGNQHFVINSSSKEDYFNNIKMYLKTGRKLREEEINFALLCYYFTQKCNFLNTYFTPQPNDFLVWSKKSVQELLDDDKIKIILSSFIDGIPLAKLNHEKLINKYNVSKYN